MIKDIINYTKVKDLLLYSIIIYKIDHYKQNLNLQDIINNNHNINNNKLLLDNLSELNKNDYILKYFYCDISNIFCFIIKNDINKEIKIIFRGTTNEINIIDNLNIKQKEIIFLENNNIKIHEGFYTQIFKGKLYNNIKNYLQSLNIINYHIYCSGHSLGGIMSTLLGYFLSYVFKNNKIIIVSFGSSRIGNKHFFKSFENIHNLICYRICNNNDLITQLPILNYKHVGIPIILSNNYFNLLINHTSESYLINLLNNNW